jgi:hypothetical protein
MKWPGGRGKPSNKSDLSKLSDDELDERMVEAGLMDQDALDRQHAERLMIALANLPGGPPEYFETLRGLVKLRDEGPFPYEAQDLYDRLRARAEADVKATRKAAPKVTPSPADVAPDTSMAGWLKAHWSSADETVRHSLRVLADKLGIPLPLRRTRRNPAQDSGSTRRTDADQHTTNDVSAPSGSPAEPKERDYYDPPASDDELADGWEPSESLTEALHDALDPEDRGWY